MQFLRAAGVLALFGAALFSAGVPGQSPSPQTEGTAKATPERTRPSATETAGAGKRKILCKTPENASLCYWTHGRLSYYSVNFTWLLWKIGTHRLLKICDESTFKSMQSTGDCADPEFPANLKSVYEIDRRRWKGGGGRGDYFPPDVFADFEICPLEPERKGVRQYACLESAKITFVQK